MAKYLVIVESPAKVKTIKKFLGNNYEVTASMGHVRDLPKSVLGVDVEHDYEPRYITIRGKGDLLAKLRREVKKAEKIYLATDPDREGEAISWHLYEALNLGKTDKKVYRITFNEITKNAVKESLKNARAIDMNLVDAQQARRILDRMVGYSISPVLWEKVKRGLSAGRVQSVALRIIADREAEIDAFIPKEYWTIDAAFSVDKSKKDFVCHYTGDKDGNKDITCEADARRIEEAIKASDFKIADIKRGERTRKAPLPFTTSTLQQEASKVLNFSTQKTMRVAQQLYEGVDIKGQGTVGIITYLRTDSTRISDEANTSAKDYISSVYGADYVGAALSAKKDTKKIQDAHEAIRPTDIARLPEEIKASLTAEQFKLYRLIWKRYVASRMSEAVYDTLSVKLEADIYKFTGSAASIRFDGFKSVYQSSDDEDDKQDNASFLKNISKDSVLEVKNIDSKQHFTQPPAHYNEASLVKALEELGIGRPSTYAPTITTILSRRYIVKEQKNLFITELGDIVNKIMMDAFPSIVDVNFTAMMENLLDSVGEGSVKWKTIVSNFYPDLEQSVANAKDTLAHVEIKDEETDITCEKCGRKMVIKYGPHGKFIGCPGFPECHNTKPYHEKLGVACPKCGSDLVILNTKKGRRYYGCEGYPECDFVSWNMPVDEKCPDCGSILVKKGGKLMCIDEKCGFVKSAPKK